MIVTETQNRFYKNWIVEGMFEEECHRQISEILTLPFVKPYVAVMPDAHAGKGSCVGTVIPTKGAVIPATVGVDLSCVDEETEFLSTSGWRKIKDWDNHLIMQCKTNGVAEFVKPYAFIKNQADEWYTIKTKGVNQKVSPEHKLLFDRYIGRDRHLEQQTLTAEEFATIHNKLKNGIKGFFRTSFYPQIKTSLPISFEELKIMVMIIADGHYCNVNDNKVIMQFKKERKIDRCKKLLKDANIQYRLEEKANNIVQITFYAPRKEKDYQNYWGCSLQQLQIIASECLFWDGNQKDCFYTRSKISADFIHYVFAATGHRSVLRIDKHYRDNKDDYRVFCYENKFTGVSGNPKTDIKKEPAKYGEYKYCFTVPSGFWVMRRNGNICVTGNCGMVAVNTGMTYESIENETDRIFHQVSELIPMGKSHYDVAKDKGVWKRHNQPSVIGSKWKDFLMVRYEGIRDLIVISEKSFSHQLGTLGGGNHFIELCTDQSNLVWVVVHSGSRGIGHKIGTHFIKTAQNLMDKWFIQLPNKDLSYLAEGTDEYKCYQFCREWAHDFAWLSRCIMVDLVLSVMGTSTDVYMLPKLTIKNDRLVALESTENSIHCPHNYISIENHFGHNLNITRKGAIQARKGTFGIIPGSMGAKTFLVEGLGNPESFCSASHGAGRIMSRNKAKQNFTKENLETATDGVICRKDEGVIDEIPMAYKPIDLVMAAQQDLVKPINILKQFVCWKG